MYALEHYEQALSTLPKAAFSSLVHQMLPRLRQTVSDQLLKLPTQH